MAKRTDGASGRRGGSVNGRGKARAKSPARPDGKVRQPEGARARNGKQLPVVPAARQQVPCLSCGLCCDYLAIEINPPSTLYAANEILWQLYHDGVMVYVEDGDWILQVETRCRHLQDDKKCAIYEQRPVICRQYDETTCEVNSPEVGRLMQSPQEFLDYLQQHYKRVYNALRKRNVPDDPRALAPRRGRRTLPAFEPRYRKLRQLGAG